MSGARFGPNTFFSRLISVRLDVILFGALFRFGAVFLRVFPI
jgi:hypothetical protein